MQEYIYVMECHVIIFLNLFKSKSKLFNLNKKKDPVNFKFKKKISGYSHKLEYIPKGFPTNIPYVPHGLSVVLR
jgi:hypothetical protein